MWCTVGPYYLLPSPTPLSELHLLCQHYLSACINASSLAPLLLFLALGSAFIIGNTITMSLPSCCPASISSNNFYLWWRSPLIVMFQIERKRLVVAYNLYRLHQKRPSQFIRASEDATTEEEESSLHHLNPRHDPHLPWPVIAMITTVPAKLHRPIANFATFNFSLVHWFLDL